MAGRRYRPTKRRNNWERLQAVFNWANLTANGFAMRIGLTRAEHLYQIKKGNFGISPDLAERIVGVYPEINRDWLLTGIGSMFLADEPKNTHIPYFETEMESILPILAQCEPTGYMDMPLTNGCDLIVRTFSPAMTSERSIVVQLFLRQVDATQVCDDKEYVFIINREVVWRRVEAIEGYKFTLRALNEDIFPDVIIDSREIVLAWHVAAKMDIFEY